tara:strand:+ start:64 stop:393 length:330 start_codon:yes stop_codon:yes gene_type:complete
MKKLKNIFTAIKNEIIFLYTEIKNTFSDKPSSLSSKRIERMLLFMTALIASNAWFWTHHASLNAQDLCLYLATNLGYAGFTLVQSQKEKKPIKEDSVIENVLEKKDTHE